MEEDHDPTSLLSFDDDEAKDAVPSAALNEEELVAIKSKRRQVQVSLVLDRQ